MSLVLGLWGLAVAAGVVFMLRYSTRAGAEGVHPERWPTASRLLRTPGRPTLLLFVHPKCSCSRASLAELAHILDLAPGEVSTQVVFLRPDEAGPGWQDTDTYRSAQRLAGVDVVTDLNGTEAARFGAMTSGQALLYDREGILRFAGGITPSRGHEGDNVGRRHLAALLRGDVVGSRGPEVFGCAIQP